MMKMFKKKDGDPKKVKAAIKKTAKSATKEGGSEAMQSMTKRVPVSTLKRIVKDVPAKRVPVSTLTRSVKTVMRPTPTPTATLQRSTRNSKTGEVTKYPAKEMKMKSISKKEFSESKPKMQKTPSATLQRSTRNSKTGEVTKSTPEKMGMKSITEKEFYK